MAVRGLEAGQRAALLVNECQRGILDPELAGLGGLAAQSAERGIAARIAELAAVFRAAGAPVVYSTIVTREDRKGSAASCLLLAKLLKDGAVTEGGEGADILPELRPEPGDFVVRRMQGLTPFHGTELEPLLRNLGVQTVVVTGVSTNIGVPGACLEAVNRGFQVVVPEDCTAGAWPEAHEFQVRHTLPLLATVTTSARAAEAVRAAAGRAARTT
jgi:nicotinamidase-related amidase